jgi:hypothetical protein
MGVMEKLVIVSPLLASTATCRSGGDEMPGYYSDELDMWAVDTADGPVPIIQHGVLNELLTKTNANTEQDDESWGSLELLTKTFQKVEGDDESIHESSGQLLQLLTKTEANAESDDRSDSNYLLQLITKTDVELERDDNGDPSFSLETRFYSD